MLLGFHTCISCNALWIIINRYVLKNDTILLSETLAACITFAPVWCTCNKPSCKQGVGVSSVLYTPKSGLGELEQEVRSLSQLYAQQSHGTTKFSYIKSKGGRSSTILTLGAATFYFAYGTRRPWAGSENQQHKSWSREVVVGQEWGMEYVGASQVGREASWGWKDYENNWEKKKKQHMCLTVCWCSTAGWAAFFNPLVKYLFV